MDDVILEQMEAEAGRLEAKLTAIRALLSLYRGDAPAQPSTPAYVSRPREETRSGGDQKDAVRRVAIAFVANSKVLPVPTRAIMTALEEADVNVSGDKPQNVVSSILSRSPELKSNGRSGWSLVETDNRYGGHAPNENEAHSGDAASASDTDTSSAGTLDVSPSTPDPLG